MEQLDGYFCEALPEVGTKDALSMVSRMVVVEYSELVGLRRADVSSLKAFITARKDMFRPPYGRSEVSRSRRAVFIGTTNDEMFLSDPTGNRRFLPLAVGHIAIEDFYCHRDQLWAEATVRFSRGEKWHLTGAALSYASEAQKERELVDVWEETISRWLFNPISSTGMTTTALLAKALSVHVEHQNRACEMRVAGIMKRLGYKQSRITVDEQRLRVWGKV